jgi:hypothetical protein
MTISDPGCLSRTPNPSSKRFRIPEQHCEARYQILPRMRSIYKLKQIPPGATPSLKISTSDCVQLLWRRTMKKRAGVSQGGWTCPPPAAPTAAYTTPPPSSTATSAKGMLHIIQHSLFLSNTACRFSVWMRVQILNCICE